MVQGAPSLMGEISDFGLGQLVKMDGGATLSYQPYEVSRRHLGILSDDELSEGDQLYLKVHKGRPIPFSVFRISTEKQTGLKRYLLACREDQMDIEQVFIYSGCMKKLEVLTRRKIQSTRYETDPTINCEVSTFGSSTFSRLSTVDISKSGMLLEVQGGNAPFIQNTLLEIRMLDKGGWLDQSLQCLGKVVRSYHEHQLGGSGKGTKFFGVRLVELESKGASIWHDVLITLSDRAISKKLG